MDNVLARLVQVGVTEAHQVERALALEVVQVTRPA